MKEQQEDEVAFENPGQQNRERGKYWKEKKERYDDIRVKRRKTNRQTQRPTNRETQIQKLMTEGKHTDTRSARSDRDNKTVDK